MPVLGRLRRRCARGPGEQRDGRSCHAGLAVECMLVEKGPVDPSVVEDYGASGGPRNWAKEAEPDLRRATAGSRGALGADGGLRGLAMAEIHPHRPFGPPE
jgi:hypothetical protein